MTQVLIITIPVMFGGGQLRLIDNQTCCYREEGVDLWEPIENLGGSLQVTQMSQNQTNGTTTMDTHPVGMTTPGTSTG